MNGVTCMSPEPMLEGKGQNMTTTEKKLWTLQNGKLKSGLTERLLVYQDRLDVLGKYGICLYTYRTHKYIYYIV